MQDVLAAEAFSSTSGIVQGSLLSGDPASALRAAALSTLKSKRRHPQLTANLRPAHNDTSVRLDYGEASELPLAVLPVTFTPASASSATKQHPLEAEDGQAREEGEISDSETSAAPHNRSIPQLKSTPLGIEDAGARRPPALSTETSPHVAHDEILPQPTSPSIARRPDNPSSEQSRVIIDADHVRPGLTMTQEQYNQAKDIILDLLGWGVDPEYLVQCNLSREIIYYVFNELNLKMPSNLDTVDLIPYPPSSKYLNSTPGAIRPSGFTAVKTASPNPIGPDPTSVGTEKGRASRHHDFPVKPPKFSRLKSAQASSPPVPAEPAPSASTTSPASPAPSSSPVTPHPSLHDMERQRRQELLARKAVQASRKPKLSQGETLPGAEPKDRDMDLFPDSPQVSVDDFLNSIGPVPPLDNKIPTSGPHGDPVTEPSDFESSSMEVDVPSSDVVGDPGPARLITPPHSPMSVQSSSASVRSCSAPSTDPTPDSSNTHAVMEPPSNLRAVPSTDPSGIRPDNEKASHTSENSNGATQPTSRRGLKRPVAADFVDIESGPSRSHPGNGHANGTTSWKKSGSFAIVSGVRRCVIDLSDSEDEYAVGGMKQDSVNGGERRTQPSSVQRPSTPVIPTQPRAHSGRTTPMTPLQSGTSSPAALMEKEEEIRRMRELIAQREQNRLKKLALVQSSRSTRNATRPEGDDSVNSSLRTSVDGRDQLNSDIVMQEPDPPKLPPLMAAPTPLADATISGYISPPIDGATQNAVDIATTAGDAGQEGTNAGTTQVVRQPFVAADEEPGSVDVTLDGDQDSTLGVQGIIDQADSPLHAYDSLFERYPLLRPHLRPVFSGTAATLESVWEALLPSLKELKLATVTQMLDPQKRICQYEVPGGGACRAEECDDVHLSTVDPGDTVSAQYVYEGFPEEWQRRFNVGKLETALANVRERNLREGKTRLGLEARVRQALLVLGEQAEPGR